MQPVHIGKNTMHPHPKPTHYCLCGSTVNTQCSLAAVCPSHLLEVCIVKPEMLVVAATTFQLLTLVEEQQFSQSLCNRDVQFGRTQQLVMTQWHVGSPGSVARQSRFQLIHCVKHFFCHLPKECLKEHCRCQYFSCSVIGLKYTLS